VRGVYNIVKESSSFFPMHLLHVRVFASRGSEHRCPGQRSNLSCVCFPYDAS